MTNKPLISILICTYNAKHTIVETINSCLNQTYDHIEILIHDDQSTDNTVSLINSINNDTIKIIDSGTKLGPYGGLNLLMEAAKGDYVAIQDHDDLWMSEKLMRQVEFLESAEGQYYVGCGTKTRMLYEGDSRYFDYYLGKGSYYTVHPSLVFRNNGYKYPNDRVYMNDAYFQKIILCQGEKKIYNINETLTTHRIKSGAENFSYRWFKFNKKNVQTIFTLHPRWYAGLAMIREGMRKACYPIVQKTGKGGWIDQIERIPFRLQGYQVKDDTNLS